MKTKRLSSSMSVVQISPEHAAQSPNSSGQEANRRIPTYFVHPVSRTRPIANTCTSKHVERAAVGRSREDRMNFGMQLVVSLAQQLKVATRK